MLIPIRAAVATLCLIAAAACASRTTVPAVPAVAGTPRLLGACCAATDDAIFALMRQYENTDPSARTAELAILSYRMSSGLSERERIVVRDPDTWTALWPRIVGSHRPMPGPPAVNFSREMLVVASMGTRATGGYTIMIDSVSAGSGRLLVFLREQSPGPRCGVTAALTAPVALGRLDRSDLPVSFVTESVVRDC